MIIIHQPKASGTSLRFFLARILGVEEDSDNVFFRDAEIHRKYAGINTAVFSSHCFPTKDAIATMLNIAEEHKILFLFRDLEGATGSLLDMKSHTLRRIHSFGDRQLPNILKWFREGWEAIEHKNILHVHYEDLTGENAVEEMDRIFDFLEIHKELRQYKYPKIRVNKERRS